MQTTNDPDRLTRIAHKVQHGLWPDSVDDVRWLLGQLGVPVESRKRCNSCNATGLWASVPQIVECAVCHGTGYQLEQGAKT
jgi:hypothetical protein